MNETITEPVATLKAASIIKQASEAEVIKIADASAKAVIKLNNSSDLAAEKIRHVADEVALKLVNLASSASDALAKLTATQAAAAVQVVAASGAGDHDLLIELKTMMKVMQDSVTKIETGNSLQIKDHEQRLDKLDDKVSANEKKTSNMFTIVTIYSIAIAAVIGLLVTHILSK